MSMTRKPTDKPLGYIAYEGPSRIDGEPIVVIVNRIDGSDNEKTGAMAQTFIIRADVPPVEALATGADVSVCGACPHRPSLVSAARAAGLEPAAPCYVNVGRSVRAVYDAYRRGRYTRASIETIAHALRGVKLRIGTYGDPAAAPVEAWHGLIKLVAGHTGYTHQWQSAGFDVAAWAPLVMASADTVAEREQAHALGMRTFRVSIGHEPATGEVTCPASAEGGRKATCATCMLCGGTSKAARSIVIADHASGHARRVIALRSL